MVKLPLFPLNTVLFPGVPLNLHIFEDRYKLMINRCVQTGTPFGVLMLQSGAEVQGMAAAPAIPYTVGCTAQIIEVQPLGQGRMNIVAVGEERFRVEAFEYDEPYLVGQVEMLPITSSDPARIAPTTDGLRSWVMRYLRALEKSENLQIDLSQLPQDALAFAYLAAYLIKIAPHQKQALLGTDDALELVQQVRSYYRREVTLMEMTLNQPKEAADGRPFSLN